MDAILIVQDGPVGESDSFGSAEKMLRDKRMYERLKIKVHCASIWQMGALEDGDA